MKILWTSNSPMIETGYGKQTRLFAQQMIADGHELTIFANYGHAGGALQWGDMTILPVSRDRYGRDALLPHYQSLKPDVNIMLYDIWPFENNTLEAINLTAYAPVDHDVLPPLVADRLKHTAYQWAMSRHAETQMKAHGLTPFYVPHMVDCDQFKPMDRAQAREQVKVEDGVFFVVMVAAHKGFPLRKSFDRVLRAWAAFVKDHPNARLHIHTDPTPSDVNSNVDLEGIARLYNVPTHALRFPNNQKFHTGYYGDDYLNALYNAADVLLAPSMGEGFGVPAVEAQASGCPVIVSDFTAQSELAGPGYKVPIYDDDLYWSLQGAHYCLPRYSEIVKGLEWAYAQRDNEVIRQQCREFATDYHAPTVYNKYVKPSLQAAYDIEQERNKPREWAKLGMYIDNRLWFPAHDPKDTWGRMDTPDGPVLRHDMFPNSVDGVPLTFVDDPAGGVAKVIMKEITQTYRLDRLDLSKAEYVIDIGAQVGVVSSYLAKKYPNLTVIAFEPMPENYARLVQNLEANGVKDRVRAINKAVSGDGKPVTLSGNPDTNTGDNGMFTEGAVTHTIDSLTLAQIFKEFIPDGRRVALLKIDCEGAEYDILQAQPDLLNRVDALVGEFHMNNVMLHKGYNVQELINLVREHVKLVNVSPCRIDDVRGLRSA